MDRPARASRTRPSTRWADGIIAVSVVERGAATIPGGDAPGRIGASHWLERGTGRLPPTVIHPMRTAGVRRRTGRRARGRFMIPLRLRALWEPTTAGAQGVGRNVSDVALLGLRNQASVCREPVRTRTTSAEPLARVVLKSHSGVYQGRPVRIHPPILETSGGDRHHEEDPHSPGWFGTG